MENLSRRDSRTKCLTTWVAVFGITIRHVQLILESHSCSRQSQNLFTQVTIMHKRVQVSSLKKQKTKPGFVHGFVALKRRWHFDLVVRCILKSLYWDLLWLRLSWSNGPPVRVLAPTVNMNSKIDPSGSGRAMRGSSCPLLCERACECCVTAVRSAFAEWLPLRDYARWSLTSFDMKILATFWGREQVYIVLYQLLLIKLENDFAYR